LIASPSQTVGPFFHFAITSDAVLAHMAGAHTHGERIHLRIRVLDGAADPVPDAMIELWHADAEGGFTGQPDAEGGLPGQSFRGWGRQPSNVDGVCEFDTIRPGSTTAVDGTRAAAHVNVCLFSRGMLRHVFTRMYFADDALLADDPVLALVPASRRQTLIAQHVGDAWQFEIHLQGERETVFFDL
jgi:protocatechuate 3,4-dioxygenase alpha subunit